MMESLLILMTSVQVWIGFGGIFFGDIFLPGPRTMDGFFPENSEIFDVSKGSELFEISIV